MPQIYKRRQKVVVVGAGPVGTLAAIYAAGRGDDVEVYEFREGNLFLLSPRIWLWLWLWLVQPKSCSMEKNHLEFEHLGYSDFEGHDESSPLAITSQVALFVPRSSCFEI